MLNGHFFEARGEITLLDGASGSVLDARGVDVSGPGWSARAVVERPDAVAQLHREYAMAGAVVHTANTFRPPSGVVDLGTFATNAVALARSAALPSHRVAGSLGPVADCYTPRATPADARSRHRSMAGALDRAGVDLFLCETFAEPNEALAAVEACLEHRRPVWLALTGGPTGTLASPDELARTAHRASRAGAAAVLVNCTAATLVADYLRALHGLEVPIGVYANAGAPEEELGYLRDWASPMPPEEEMQRRALRYAALARTWMDLGATILGGCCGTFPAHVAALRKMLEGHQKSSS
jgi:S-methylmethionine-dependent homocysteine/selenocysteine methylase